MSSDAVIRVEGLGKQYRLGERLRSVSLREAIPSAVRRLTGRGRSKRSSSREPETFWALKDINFEVQRGEVLGVIGHNGAGKSTLLKILSRITEPTEGSARIRGRVSSLLEVGTGFHPELTGRENVFLNGSILGMSRREIQQKFDAIVEFSGVEKFLETPVKRYSSGMSVRLAFAVAAHLEPEVLIIDEVLAVGDAEFQSKCLGKMEDVATSGRTVLFVSHNMAAVESLCTRALLLNRGVLAKQGEVQSVIEDYLWKGAASSSDVDLTDHPGRVAGSTMVLQRLRMTDDEGRPLPAVSVGGDAVFEVTVDSPAPIATFRLLVEISGPRGERLMTLANHVQHGKSVDIRGATVMRAHWRNCRLVPGQYRIRLIAKSRWKKLDEISEGLTFEVGASDEYGTGRLAKGRHGCMLPEVHWTVSAG